MSRREIQKILERLECYSAMIEYSFEQMFRGNKQRISFCTQKLCDGLEHVMNKGYLTYNRYNYIRDWLREAYNGEECKIISCNSEEITVLNTEKKYSDKFSLTDYILWFVDMMIQDPLFRTELKERYDYAGVMQCLKEVSTLGEDTSVNFSKVKNAVTYGPNIYLVDESKGVYKLIKIKKKREGITPTQEELMPLSTLELFQDHNCLYVNHLDGFGRKINLSNGEESLIEGRVIFLTTEGLLVKKGKELLLQRNGKALKRLGKAKDIYLNLRETRGISWISQEKGQPMFQWHKEGEDKQSHSLKSDIVWRYILSHAYHFTQDSEKKMSSMLWAYKCCKTPVPFTAGNIRNSIHLIEQSLCAGLVKRAPAYMNIVYPILSMENTVDVTDELFDSYNIQMKDIDYLHDMGSRFKRIATENEFFRIKCIQRENVNTDIIPEEDMCEETDEECFERAKKTLIDMIDQALMDMEDDIFDDFGLGQDDMS